ncbi:MFS transporter [Herbaspirillum sp. WKF16]|uniref:MFS transporter n=1 Tax=Herbaspirillum sp. WKF16 TaxID=3028312 RepID=UPI0031580D6B
MLVGAFLPPLDFFIVNVALPSIRAGLGADPAEVQLVISGYAAVYAVFLITGGRLGDLYGRKRVFLAGLMGFGLSSTLCGFATSPAILIAGRLLQGLSAAIMAPQGLASIQALFPERERARALSMYGATIGLAAIAAQALGGLLIAANIGGLQWRVIFLINLPVVAIVFLGGIPLLPDTRSANPARLDRMGVLLCALSLGLLVVPLVKGPEAGWPWWTCLMLVSSPGFAIAFWRYELALTQRGGTPLVSPQLAKAPGLVVALTGVLFFYVVSAFFLTFSIYLQEAIGKSAFSTGLMFVPCGLGFLIGPLTTPAATRWFGRWTPVLGMALEVVGCLVLSAVVATTPVAHAPALAGVVVALSLIGFGQGIAVPTLVRSVIDRAPTGGSGMVAGIVNSALQISAALGVAIIGSVFFSLAGSGHTPSSLAHAFSWAMLCVAASLTAAALLVARASRTHEDAVKAAISDQSA